MFYRESEHSTLEALRLYGPNVVIFQLTLGGQLWYVVGCYITPEYALTIEAVYGSIFQWHRGAELLAVITLNANLAAPQGDMRNEEITSDLTAMGLEDMISYFIPQCNTSDMEHDPRGMGGALPNLLHPGNRPLSAPEHVVPGRAA